jgi:PAS domain S-box-containing protein
VETGDQLWTDEVFRIHELDKATCKPKPEEGIRFYAPSSRPIIERAFQRAIDYGEPYDLELELITAKGNKRWVHTIGKAHREDGKTIRVAGTFQDITERKQVEDELQKHRLHLKELVEQRTAELVKANETIKASEMRFRVIFERSTIGKALTTPDGRLLEINRAFAAMLGYTIEEMEQLNFAEVTYADDLPKSRESVRTLLANECTSYRMEQRYVRKDGGIIWTDVGTTLLRDAGGTPLYFITSIVDITERKRAEEKLGGAMTDLERSNRELEQFAYVASHDLQEPLRKVASFTQLLAERYADKLDEDARQFIGYAVDGAHRMQGLINDLLAYSRVGTRGSEFAPVDGEVAFETAVGNLQMAILETGAEVTHGRLPTILGDGTQLVQLFQNLIGNAIKFHGKAPPRVHVAAARQEKEWVFQVSDNGIGIAPEYFNRLFVIFQRLHSRAEYPGTGIGLAISKRVVERHGGRIWVESEPGNGSTFFFTIPTN